MQKSGQWLSPLRRTTKRRAAGEVLLLDDSGAAAIERLPSHPRAKQGIRGQHRRVRGGSKAGRPHRHLGAAWAAEGAPPTLPRLADGREVRLAAVRSLRNEANGAACACPLASAQHGRGPDRGARGAGRVLVVATCRAPRGCPVVGGPVLGVGGVGGWLALGHSWGAVWWWCGVGGLR
jgi:hypothetical protein